jgi:3-methyladenine DNA glycosylase AlkD
MRVEKSIEEFQQILQINADPSKKEWWESYMKNAIGFRGVGIQKIRKLLSEWYIKHKLHEEDIEDQFIFAKDFFSQAMAEDKLTGVLILEKFVVPKTKCEKIICNVEDLFNRNYINDWNTCDWLCVKILTPIVETGRLVCVQQITNWKNSSRLWKARASAVSFAQAENKTKYIDFIDQICNTLIQREERFAKTAVAWLLREFSKDDKAYTIDFIKKNITNFTAETIRNTLKYFDDQTRQHYLNQLRSEIKNQF